MAMKLKLVAAAVVFAWSGGILQIRAADQSAGAAGSTWSGVYSDEQAKRGQAAYAKNCTECHADDLAGDGFAPSLKGPEFMNNWNGLTVGELFDRVRVSMPPSDPNAVTPKEKADIVAFVLKQNGFPAGTSELPAAMDALKAIKFDAIKPGVIR